MARRWRQKGVDTEDVPLEWFFNVDAAGNTRNVEVNHHSTARRAHTGTNSLSHIEYEEQVAVCTFPDEVAQENESREGLSDLCDRLIAMLNANDDQVGDTEVLENDHTGDYDVVQGTSDTQPATHSQHGRSAEYSVIPAVSHSTTHTPPLTLQCYATTPGNEPAEGLYDTADNVPQNEDAEATPPVADYASIVEPSQDADDTEQPPPVPAFDPEILYAQPDKTSRRNDDHAAVGDYEPVVMPHASTEPVRGADNTERHPIVLPSPTRAHYESLDFGQDTVAGAIGPLAEAGYEAVDILHQVDDKSSTGARTAQPRPAEELYSMPDMSQKRNRRRESQGSVSGEGPKDTPPGTPTAVEQLYATPDMSKKQRKQSHMSNGAPTEEQQGRDDDEDDDTPPEVPLYEPITFLPGENRT